MTDVPAHDVTQLLRAWSVGDEQALGRLIPLVHKELHRLARRYMAGESPGHTLQTTALVNEAYLRLVDVKKVSWQNRAHFFGVSAQLMRRILVDFARARRRGKRGGDASRVTLDEAMIPSRAGTDVERSEILDLGHPSMSVRLGAIVMRSRGVGEHARRIWRDSLRSQVRYRLSKSTRPTP